MAEGLQLLILPVTLLAVIAGAHTFVHVYEKAFVCHGSIPVPLCYRMCTTAWKMF